MGLRGESSEVLTQEIRPQQSGIREKGEAVACREGEWGGRGERERERGERLS